MATQTEIERYLRGNWTGFEFKKAEGGLVTVINQCHGREWFCLTKLTNTEEPHVLILGEVALLRALGHQMLAETELQKSMGERAPEAPLWRGLSSRDFETPMSADDRFYGIDPQYEIDVFKQRDFEIAVVALERIADFDPGITGSLYVRIAKDALSRMGRELLESDSGEGEDHDGE